MAYFYSTKTSKWYVLVDINVSKHQRLQLMAERDLRALDMRHTLPNLKNLLLTLSHDNTDKLPYALITLMEV